MSYTKNKKKVVKKKRRSVSFIMATNDEVYSSDYYREGLVKSSRRKQKYVRKTEQYQFYKIMGFPKGWFERKGCDKRVVLFRKNLKKGIYPEGWFERSFDPDFDEWPFDIITE